MNVSFSMFYLSVITLEFPYNKMFRSHQYQQTPQIQTIIKDKEWISKIEVVCAFINVFSDGILTASLRILFFDSTLSKFCQMILAVLLFWGGCMLIWNIAFLLVAFAFCKRSYSDFLKEWETQ